MPKMKSKTNIKLQLTDIEKANLRKNKIRIANILDFATDELEVLLNATTERAKEIYMCTKRQKRLTANIGFCNIRADGITMSICNSIWLLFGQTSFNLAFCCYLHHQLFNWALVSGGHFSNSPTRA
jgi:hypothetical protein